MPLPTRGMPIHTGPNRLLQKSTSIHPTIPRQPQHRQATGRALSCVAGGPSPKELELPRPASSLRPDCRVGARERL